MRSARPPGRRAVWTRGWSAGEAEGQPVRSCFSRRGSGRLALPAAALRQRQAQGEGSVPPAGDYLERAAHAQRELIRDRQAEPGPAGGVARVEAVEDLVDRPRVDALLGVVADDQLRCVSPAYCGDRHVRSVRRMSDGIVDQNTDDL